LASARHLVIGAPEVKGDYVAHGGAILFKDNERVDRRGGPIGNSTIGRESNGSEHGDLECSRGEASCTGSENTHVE
jgi:hypothetical protein